MVGFSVCVLFRFVVVVVFTSEERARVMLSPLLQQDFSAYRNCDTRSPSSFYVCIMGMVLFPLVNSRPFKRTCSPMSGDGHHLVYKTHAFQG